MFFFGGKHKRETETKNFVSYEFKNYPTKKVGLLLGTIISSKSGWKISTFSTELMQQNTLQIRKNKVYFN